MMLLYKLRQEAEEPKRVLTETEWRGSGLSRGGQRCPAPPPSHHQKSSTVSNVYTARSVCPQVVCFCLPLGLSNHSVHLVSSGCFLLKSTSPARFVVVIGQIMTVQGGGSRPSRRCRPMMARRVAADPLYVSIARQRTLLFLPGGSGLLLLLRHRRLLL